MSSPDPRLRGLYAITDPALLPGERLLQGVAAALRGGARLIQYRDKGTDPARRLARPNHSLTGTRNPISFSNFRRPFAMR